MRIMHIADLHLGCRMYDKQQREEDFYEALRRVGDIALENSVEAVLISGDMFDTAKPPAKAVCEVSEFVEKMRTEGVDVVGIEGNHDTTQDNYWLRVCGIWPLGAAPFENSMTGVRIAGFNHCPTDRLFDELEAFANECEAKKEEWPVVSLHLGLAEMGSGFNPDASAMQLVPLLKRIGCKYLALGHIHIPMEQFFDGISFVQPGSLELKSIDEPEQKSVEILEILDGKVAQKRVPYRTRRVVHVSINSEEDVQKLADEVGKVSDAFVVAFVDKGIMDGIARVSEILSKCAVFRVISRAALEDNTLTFERKKAMNFLMDAITAYFPKDSIRYNLVTRIISTGDPRSALEDLMNSELDLSEETKGE